MIDRGSYYADALRQAMTKRDMDTILRIVATTCETDLGRIKNLYNQRYQKTLEEGIHVSQISCFDHLSCKMRKQYIKQFVITNCT